MEARTNAVPMQKMESAQPMQRTDRDRPPLMSLQKVDPAQPPLRTDRDRQSLMPLQKMEPLSSQVMRNELAPMQQVEPVPQQLMRGAHSHTPLVPMVPMQKVDHGTQLMRNEHSPLMSVQKVEPPQQIMRTERHLFSSSDDNVMMRQIQGTHAPDGREVDIKPLLNIVENILLRATPSTLGVQTTTQAHMDALDDKTHQESFIGMLEALAYTIHKISCEISCKCSGGGDVHTTTLSLFNMLSSYSWDAKVVLALAAFAVNYGEFWLLAQIYPTNHLAKSIAVLKQLPDIMEHSASLRPRFEALNNLISAMLDVTKCILELKELPTQYITPESSVMTLAMAHVPTASYWTIRSVVACAAQIIALIGLGHEYITATTEVWELSGLAQRVRSIHDHLKKQLALCHQYIDEKRQLEAYQTLVRLFDTIHIDNMKILRALFYTRDDMPLFDGSNKRRVSLEILRRKNVLVLISDLDISNDELSILEQMYRESREHPNRPESQYEVVWLPIVDKLKPWTDEKQRQFEDLQMQMPWFTVHQPTLIDPAVIKYIREMWHFTKKPLLVVLDPQGRVVCLNALHMMWIWGSLAFPFTSSREEALWNNESWRLELLVDGIDQELLNWISTDKYICLYGGEDLEWIRKFTATAQAVAAAARISLEMVYVGKSNPRERVRRNVAAITMDHLSHCFQDLTSIWFFWVRLESMCYSKMQLGRSVENDPIMQEIMTMLSFDGSDQGWAVISRGSAEIAKGKGDTMLTTFTQFDLWKEQVELKGFIPALKDHLQQLHTPHHCNRLILPGTVGRIPELIVCAECGRPMEKMIMYRCCTD